MYDGLDPFSPRDYHDFSPGRGRSRPGIIPRGGGGTGYQQYQDYIDSEDEYSLYPQDYVSGRVSGDYFELHLTFNLRDCPFDFTTTHSNSHP